MQRPTEPIVLNQVRKRLHRALALVDELDQRPPPTGAWPDVQTVLDLERLVGECRHAAEEANDELLIQKGSPYT